MKITGDQQCQVTAGKGTLCSKTALNSSRLVHVEMISADLSAACSCCQSPLPAYLKGFLQDLDLEIREAAGVH